jgi:hypothetical protein
MDLRSVLDTDVASMAGAERSLAELAADWRLRVRVALAAISLGVGAAVVDPHLRVGIAVAVMGTLALPLLTRHRRRVLLAQLVRDRRAYTIAAVREAGERFASPRRRRTLAAGLRSVVRGADDEDHHLGYMAPSLDERVRPRRERMLAIADALESAGQPPHPASTALVHALLTRPSSSPLYNPGLAEDVLDLSLHRIEAGAGLR